MKGRHLTIRCSGPDPASFSNAVPIAWPQAGSVHLWFATLEDLRPWSSAYGELLDPLEVERAQRFRFDQDRERFTLGHGFLRTLLGRYLDRDGSLIRFARGRFGKPFLEGKDLHFNFSDTKDAILVGFTSGQEIGVDIETMKRNVDHVSVGEHYFTTEEIAEIGSLGAATQNGKRRFLELWTRKEAVLKASGVGLMDDLRVLHVNAPHNEMTIEHESFVQMAAAEYHVRTWHVGDEHLVSLASETAFSEVRLQSLA